MFEIYQGVQTNYTLHLFSIFSLLCSDYVPDLIKKLELCLTVLSVLLKIWFGHAQISVAKIGIPLLKTAFIKFNNFKFKFNNLGRALPVFTLQQCGKRVKIKSHKVLEANSNVCTSYMEKLAGGEGAFCS